VFLGNTSSLQPLTIRTPRYVLRVRIQPTAQ